MVCPAQHQKTEQYWQKNCLLEPCSFGRTRTVSRWREQHCVDPYNMFFYICGASGYAAFWKTLFNKQDSWKQGCNLRSWRQVASTRLTLKISVLLYFWRVEEGNPLKFRNSRVQKKKIKGVCGVGCFFSPLPSVCICSRFDLKLAFTPSPTFVNNIRSSSSSQACNAPAHALKFPPQTSVLGAFGRLLRLAPRLQALAQVILQTREYWNTTSQSAQLIRVNALFTSAVRVPSCSAHGSTKVSQYWHVHVPFHCASRDVCSMTIATFVVLFEQQQYEQQQ